jgi:hypothetical protein
MIEIVSIAQAGDEFEGMIALDSKYLSFVTRGNDIQYGFEYDNADYRDYEHFEAVIGKFNPYTFFLEQPIEVELLTRESIERAWEKVAE